MSDKPTHLHHPKLKAMRAAAGLSQIEAAHAIGVHPQTIKKLERGEIGLREDMGIRLAAIYHCQPWELVSGAPSLSSDERLLLDLAAKMPANLRAALIRHAAELAQLAAQTDDAPDQEDPAAR